MPGADATDLSETSVRLSGESGDSESLDDSGSSLTSGNTNGIDHLVVREDFTDSDFLFKVVLSPGDLLGDGASVNLDLVEVGLSLSELDLLDLGVHEHSHDLAVLADSVEVSLDRFLGVGLSVVSFGVLGESLLFGEVPVLVESPLDVVGEVLGPDGGEGPESPGGLNVTDDTDNLDWGSLDDGDGLDDVLLDHLLTLSSLVVSDNVGHASLVS
mmetsp:Transcript_30321/g.26865  ORF Transcript_30321/g.26865 Transcript_30321/m.26865 type:complete len:214 (-) Transcript_30321:129-770(-)